MSKRSGFYPCPVVDTAGSMVVSQAGAVLLTETVRAVGLDQALTAALAPWRSPHAVHDPAKVLLDLAVTLAVGGDCLADIAVLRAEPGLYGLVASDPTVSRTVDRLAADPVAALRAIHTARAQVRAVAWRRSGDRAPDRDATPGRPLVIDVDATLITAHSDKEGAAPTFKRGYGHHPLWAFVDHGGTGDTAGTGEPLAVLLRPGNAGSNTAADHITVIREALRQLPGHRPGTRPGRKVLVRTDSAGGTHELLNWLVGQRLSYSVGFTLPEHIADILATVPESDWQIAYDVDGEPRPGAAAPDYATSVARAGPEPDLVRHRRPGLRAHHLNPAAHPARTPRGGGNPNAYTYGSSPSPAG